MNGWAEGLSSFVPNVICHFSAHIHKKKEKKKWYFHVISVWHYVKPQLPFPKFTVTGIL